MIFNSSQYSDIRFGIKDDAERYFWAAYFLLGLLSALFGDTLILYASFQKDAFKVNKFIATVIQHIAVSDLLNAICFALPHAISLITNSWVLGDVMCSVRTYVSFAIYAAGLYLIAVLTTSKFLLLRYPFRSASFSTKKAQQICSLIWVLSLINPAVKMVVESDDVHFDYRIYTCDYGYNATAWKTISPIKTFIYGIVPYTIIVATTVPTLKYLVGAWKSAGRVGGIVPWQGAMTVALTAVVFTVSTLPFLVYHIVKTFTREGSSGRFQIHFFRISYFLLMINIVANFYIYALTIPSFRKFVYSKLLTIVPDYLKNSRDIPPATGTKPLNQVLLFLSKNLEIHSFDGDCRTCILALVQMMNYEHI